MTHTSETTTSEAPHETPHETSGISDSVTPGVGESAVTQRIQNLMRHKSEGIDPNRTITYGFFLVPNFSMIAFSSAIEALRIANRITCQRLYNWVIISKDGNPITASNGIEVASFASLIEMNDRTSSYGTMRMVFVCAGHGGEHYSEPALKKWLWRMSTHGAAIGALCTGSHILARAGLLNERKCVIHWENLSGFREDFPEIEASSDLFEVDEDRATCSGGTSALDMMLYLIAEAHGSDLATRISEQCLVDRMRGPRDQQRLPLRIRLGIHHPKLIAAIEMMQVNIEEPLKQDELASYVGLSRRQLERLFRNQLGRSPAQFYLELRLEQARHLLYQTDMRIIDLAMASGFVSASHFSKCYRQLYSKSPREERMNAEVNF